MSRRVTITSTTTGTMSALNMAMNGNAYKMIEIKKVSGPVVPLRWVVMILLVRSVLRWCQVIKCNV